MKIAICDDDGADLTRLRDMVKQYDSTLDVTLFSSAKALLDAFAATFYDLVLLDIEMEAPNGYEAACQLMLGQDKPRIIFVTNSGEYTVRGYGVAFRYLTKPVDNALLSQALTAALAQLSPQKITISVDGTVHVLSLREIYYVEVTGHQIHLHLENQEYVFRGNLKEVARQLSGGSFARPHSSFLVNLDKISAVDANSAALTNGAVVPISKRNKKDFELSLVQYVRRS